MTTLAAKKAEIEKLLDEFEGHSRRVAEIACEAGLLMKSLAEDHGAEGLHATGELYERLAQIVAMTRPGSATTAGSQEIRERPKTSATEHLLTH